LTIVYKYTFYFQNEKLSLNIVWIKGVKYDRLGIVFTAKTPKLETLALQKKHQETIKKLEGLLIGKVAMYIDFANVRPWSEKLKWHISPSRLRQFLTSFDNISFTKFYQGELVGDERSKKEIEKLLENKYIVRTKPVKIMKLSIDASSVSKQSPDLLVKFIRKTLLRQYNLQTVEYLNDVFAELNARGIHYLEDRKCNFDVEIATDMRVDHLQDGIETFVLWSGDSDFADPINTLIEGGKNVVLFATAGRVSRELNALVGKGLFIFDIAELRGLICWKDEQQTT